MGPGGNWRARVLSERVAATPFQSVAAVQECGRSGSRTSDFFFPGKVENVYFYIKFPYCSDPIQPSDCQVATLDLNYFLSLYVLEIVETGFNLLFFSDARHFCYPM